MSFIALRRSVSYSGGALSVLSSKGKVRHISGLVFPSEAGTKLNSSNLRCSFNAAVKESGIEKLRFHDLRHTFATRLVQAGIDLYSVKELLGHKSIKMTMRYAHHNPESLRHGVDVLDRLEDDSATMCYNSATVAQKKATVLPVTL